MASMTSIIGRKLLAGVIAFTVATGLIATALVTGVISGAQASTETTTTATSTKKVDPDVARFKAAVEKARALTGQARTDALKKIHTDARAGTYGDKVEKRLDGKSQIWGNAPKELRADLKAARAADAADRPAKLHAVFTKALAGDYGDQAKKHAAELQVIVNGK